MLVRGLEFNTSPLMTPETDVAAPHIHCPILIVEDEFFISSDLEQILADAGAETVLVDAAGAAMEKLASTRFDAVILD